MTEFETFFKLAIGPYGALAFAVITVLILALLARKASGKVFEYIQTQLELKDLGNKIRFEKLETELDQCRSDLKGCQEEHKKSSERLMQINREYGVLEGQIKLLKEHDAMFIEIKHSLKKLIEKG